MSEKKIDFYGPLVLDALYKEPGEDGTVDTGKEVVQEIAALWFDIVELRSYPHSDEDWIENKGDKFYITFRESGTFLVKGSFRHMLRLWKEFCKEQYGKNPND